MQFTQFWQIFSYAKRLKNTEFMYKEGAISLSKTKMQRRFLSAKAIYNRLFAEKDEERTRERLLNITFKIIMG